MGASVGLTSAITIFETSEKSLMYQPGFTSKMIGKPAWCDSRCHIRIFSRPKPANSGMRLEIGVVSEKRPCSMAWKTSRFVKALVTEKMLKTESSARRCCAPSAVPMDFS